MLMKIKLIIICGNTCDDYLLGINGHRRVVR